MRIDYSSEEGDAKNGNLVEEAYEYLVRNVYPVGASVCSVGCLEYTSNRRDNYTSIPNSKRSPALTLYEYHFVYSKTCSVRGKTTVLSN